ncbi:MAG: septum formation family protein [Acidimicrobiales bacterium]|nr:septum formation family protein [Acidimicrobiales bacterium]MCB1013671.1 septum formation family protein [Acidimicrobiales bacterium]
MPGRLRLVALVAAATALGALVGGCADSDPPSWLEDLGAPATTTSAPTTTTVAPAGGPTTTAAGGGAATPVTDLVTGDCLTGPPVTGAPATETTDVTVTDCAGGHDGEVIGVVTYTQGPEVAYPGQEQVAAYADEQCPVAFEAYVGVPYGNSSLALLSLWPTEASWSGGDREAVCVAYEPDTQLTGSVQGRGTP